MIKSPALQTVRMQKIPGKQAVVIMACENEHMGESMTLEPGLVMIFAHGIE